MSCNGIINIGKGNYEAISYELTSDVLSFTFTTSGLVVPPEPNDVYTATVSNVIDGVTVTTVNLLVTSVNGNIVTCQSILASNTDDNGNVIVPTTGTLDKVTGSGDLVISYTATTTDNYIDTEGKTVKLAILTEVVDNPAPEQVVTIKNGTSSGKGTGLFIFPVSETETFTPGQYYGVIEIFTSATNLFEQRDNEVFSVIINKDKV